MLGRIDVPTIAVCALAVLATGSDVACGRIFNSITVSFAVAGVIYGGFSQGFAGAGSSALGILVGLLLYGWMFWARVLGGGDVKLLMAFGAWGGSRYALNVAILGIILGGGMAVLWLVVKGKSGEFAGRAYRFFMTLFVRELELEPFKLDRRTTMPFAIPISVAAVWVQLSLHFGLPFERWGLF